MERAKVYLLIWVIIISFVWVSRNNPTKYVISDVSDDYKYNSCLPDRQDFHHRVKGNSFNMETPISVVFCNFEKNHDFYLLSAKTGILFLNFQTNESEFLFITNYDTTEFFDPTFLIKTKFMKFYLWDSNINNSVQTVYINWGNNNSYKNI